MNIPDVIECGESGSGSLTVNSDGTTGRAVALRWLVKGMSGYDAAEARGKILAPDFFRGHRRVRLEPQVVGGGWYLITAEYANGSILLQPSPGAVGTFGSWGFDFESKTEHITQAFSDSQASAEDRANPNAYIVAHIAGHQNIRPGALVNGTWVVTTPASPDYQPASPDYSPGPPVIGTPQVGTPSIPGHWEGGFTVPDFRGALGVEPDTVRGTDIPKASLSWNETWHFPAYMLTNSRPPLKKLSMPDANGNRTTETVEQPRLLDVWEQAAFHINAKPFRGFEVGEVLMSGPRSPQIHDGQTMASVTFSFSVSRDRKNFYVGDILVPWKGGWDLLDIYYETAAESTQTLKRPRMVYCCRVLPHCDFETIGISTEWPTYWLDPESLKHQFDSLLPLVT